MHKNPPRGAKIVKQLPDLPITSAAWQVHHPVGKTKEKNKIIAIFLFKMK